MLKKAILVFAFTALIGCGGGGTSDGGFDISPFVGTHAATLSASVSDGDTITSTLEITVREDGVVILNFQDDNVLTGMAETNTVVIEASADQLLAAAGCLIGTIKVTIFLGAVVSGVINGEINSEGVVICDGTLATITGVIQVP